MWDLVENWVLLESCRFFMIIKEGGTVSLHICFRGPVEVHAVIHLI
jgi:hypothetical protein